ncbi:MAG: NF038122 family metalloprotease [Proteobacteria bacterium]|nr:NF038122 family metalloprotease [Pseudomonadota bacterium]
MKIRLLSAGALVALAVAAAPAGAATIVLNNIGGVDPGTAAFDEFTTAANFWGSVITTNVTINLNVGFQHLGANVLGQTSSTVGTVSTASVETQLGLVSSHDTVDTSAVAHLPTLNSSGALSVYTANGTSAGVVNFGATPTLDNNNSNNNTEMKITSANAKALGYFVPASTVDGTIDFSSDFAFDFDPTNGISANQVDFLGVALHEIGHALGFNSGVDVLDTSVRPFDNQNAVYGTTLDLFRYADTGPGGAAALTWDPGVASYFSLDGGATGLCGFSTGSVHGDGWQASHWQRLGAGGGPCGIMDPAVTFGQQDAVSAYDLDAIDAIGWNLSIDPGKTSGFIDTSQIQQMFGNIAYTVPEPATWALLIVGFGLTGGALRRRRRLVPVRA